MIRHTKNLYLFCMKAEYLLNKCKVAQAVSKPCRSGSVMTFSWELCLASGSEQSVKCKSISSLFVVEHHLWGSLRQSCCMSCPRVYHYRKNQVLCSGNTEMILPSKMQIDFEPNMIWLSVTCFLVERLSWKMRDGFCFMEKIWELSVSFIHCRPRFCFVFFLLLFVLTGTILILTSY